METPKETYSSFRIGQDIIVNGTEMKIVGTDLAGNPVVESKPQPVARPEALLSRDWSDVSAGLGAVSVNAMPLYSR